MSLRRPGFLAPALLSTLILVTPAPAAGKKGSGEDEGPLSSGTFSGLAFRSIGPAVNSGRITDFAVDPGDRSRYLVAAASGGVWRTVNSGTTWTPVFDDQGSYSIGCLAMDPQNPLTIWVGTGENNSQRSVSYGDGVYKSLDGGTSWKKMGLEGSEHIAKILIDPRDPDTVYAASQGPLWSPGGDRGLFKTTDGGETWKNVLEISENTGVTDVWMDPRNPDSLIAAAYQRRRHTWTLINGGPESAIYRSTDAGESWERITSGLPTVDMGRIGLAISPADPDVVYAIVEASDGEGGFFRSVDTGYNWEKMSGYVSSSPQYYQEIVPDPRNVDRVYSLDTWMQVTIDGGKTFQRVGELFKHVDNHALYIDPDDPSYLLAGCDGGVYESYDRGATWHFKDNLPVTQFYKVTPDNDLPFYNVYGGTQDNFTIGGPARSTSASGIVNSDWFVTLGGDGFEPQVDPENPDIVYSQYQYGGLARFDRASGEIIDIQPQAAPGEPPLRWNWNSALIISPHSSTRLYYAAQRIFRSDDRGDSWKPVSPDLTRNLDRNTLEVMGRIQRPDAVAKNNSTSPYGNIVSLAESPIREGLLYAGTDDGLIQVKEPQASEWRRMDKFPGVPERSYVSDVEASMHDASRVYATFDNHKQGDFKPYVLRSDDRGASWKSIASNLPERGSVHTLAEDHLDPDLLFVGTEFGVFFSIDGGSKWVQLKGGIPVIAVRDLEIQRRENDLVAGTFGRGIYILDDYSPLRDVSVELLEGGAHLFPVKRAWMFMESYPLGLRGKSMQGDSFFTAPNPPFGAVLTYYLEEKIQTRKQRRHEAEEKAEKEDGVEPPPYPTWEELGKELREEEPAVIFTVRDADGEVIRRLTGPVEKGIHRVSWDLRFPPSEPVRLKPPDFVSPFSDPERGPMVVPGTYTVSMEKRVDGETISLSRSRELEASPLGLGTLEARDKAALLAFQRKVARLQRAVLGAEQVAGEAQSRIDHLQKALMDTPAADPALADDLLALQNRLKDIQKELSGDPVRRKYSEPYPRSIVQRVERIVSSQWASTAPPTGTNQEAYRYAGEAFRGVLADLQQLVERDLTAIEDRLESAGAPWTPGRVPRWSME